MCLRKWYKSVKLKNFFNSCSNIKSISQFCVNFCHFFRCQGHEDVEDVIYQQWISTDRTKLTTITESKEDFVDNLSSQLLKLTCHSFTTKSQSAYMKDLRLSMKPLEEIILQVDFAENYSYVVQDEIQSFHWENKQATLHPFVAYRTLNDEDGTLEHRNICVVSDIREHSTLTVCTFQQVAIGYIKESPEVKKVHYFTDGCTGQYTNKHRFINLCNYQKDFGLEAEWNFFATSYGKSPCDGIVGTVKTPDQSKSTATLHRSDSDNRSHHGILC